MTAECRKTIKRIQGYSPDPDDDEPPLVGVADCAAELAKWQNWYREAILRAHAEGESLRAIANAAGISHEKVRQIVR